MCFWKFLYVLRICLKQSWGFLALNLIASGSSSSSKSKSKKYEHVHEMMKVKGTSSALALAFTAAATHILSVQINCVSM